jgi:hypothetical protein
VSENAIDDEHVIDMVQVRNEVAAEVRARRAAGEYPPRSNVSSTRSSRDSLPPR